MCKKTFAITIKEFAEKLTAGGGINPSPADCVEYGLQRGWLESQDTASKEKAVLRKQAARIVHNFLRLELQEPDEIDGSPSYVLQDLFDCRVCAGHIIQVYVKGIMDEVVLQDGRTVFDADKEVSLSEAESIFIRVFQKEERLLRREEGFCPNMTEEPEELTLEQMKLQLREKGNIFLVDVRTKREYEEKCLHGALNIPLMSIIKNPFVFSEERDKIILLYCNEGYQSKIAAKCLMEAGYKRVAYFAWKEGMQ